MTTNSENKNQKAGNLSTFFFLYIAQSIPMSFFSTAIPVMMRQESFSLSAIGLLQLIKLPWIIKFLWSPMVDRHTNTVNDYKKWIFSSEIVYALLIFAIAFFKLHTDFYTILMLVILSLIASGTQDIATDALAVLSFNKQEKSMVNCMQSMGSFGGTVIGSGVLLLVLHHFGWDGILPCLAIFVVLALIPLLLNKNLQIAPKKRKQRAKKLDFVYFFAQKKIWKQIGFLFLYYSSLVGTLAMLRPYLVDLGYNMKEIGVMSGLVGTTIGCGASFIGGITVRKMGRFRSRILFACFILTTTVYFFALSFYTPTLWMLYVGIALLWSSYGMATIIVYTTAMDIVRPGKEGTDFTIQIVITHLSGICIAVLSGKIADVTGYQGLFLLEMALAAISLTYVLTVFKKKEDLN